MDSKTIFIIDDDPIFVFVLKKIFSKFKPEFTIHSKKNGLEGLHFLKESYSNNGSFPHFILLDINMPVLDGWQFLDQLDYLPFKNNLTIYMVSSTINSKEIERCEEYSLVKKFIPKPTSLSEVNKILELVR